MQIFGVTLMLVPIETFNISLESTQNKQQYDTKITCTEVRGKSYGYFKNSCIFFFFFGFDLQTAILNLIPYQKYSPTQ